ncbi:MAG: hypothetical protein EBW74_08890 [Betaproteobacteria bacterium]|nr:hypothetical protein [Betaproteobacteria bacterium]
MNFLRTQTLTRIADLLKVQLDGITWKTQSNLNVVAGQGISFTQVETKDLSRAHNFCMELGVLLIYFPGSTIIKARTRRCGSRQGAPGILARCGDL